MYAGAWFINLKLTMAAKSIKLKPVSINEAVLNDLASRFLLNIPREDQDDPMKLCTHIELAYWFYLDLVRPEDSSLPGCSMKEFMAAIFKHCPFLVKDSVMVDLDNYVAQWKAHKYKKPVRGGIILNRDWTKCLLVQGYPASTTWGFPKGKLEEGENDVDAAVRELFEETGFDSRGIIQEKWHLVAQVNGSEAKMYIIPGVPDDTHFEPKTRKEIRSIQWFRIDDLPRHKKDLTSKQALGKSANSFFMIIPFISQLRKWIASNSKGSTRTSKGKTISAHFQNPAQQQSHSKISTPQLHSKPAAPSAPPLDVISHHYGTGYGNETSEHRMGYGGMGTYYHAPYSGTEIQNYQPNHEGNQNPHTPVTTNFSRDDTAPIPYPPQHPHTLHPNHTLPAPLHHVTTGHYSPGHNAVYPSHLTYTNTPHVHTHQQFQYHSPRQLHSNQVHHQQQQPPQVHSYYNQHYIQPVARHSGGNVQPIQQYGMNSPQRGSPDSDPIHAGGPINIQNMATHPAKPPPAVPPLAGMVSNPPPRTAFPVVAPTGHLSPQAYHRMAAAPTQHPQYYHNIHSHHAAAAPVHTAAVPVHVAAVQQPPPPTATQQYHHYQTHSAQLQAQGQLYGKFGHQQAFQSQYKAFESGQPVLNKHHSPVDMGKDGYRVELKPAANMVKFKFNTEAILKASNIR